MPTAATLGNAQSSSKSETATVATVPFIRASSEHREPAGIDITRQLTTSDQDLGVFDIPAYGYLRAITIVVTATGGAGAATAAADAPWTAIKNIAFTEPNGATIAQFNSGYDLYLAHKWGGYGGYSDPKGVPTYSAPAASGGNFKFKLRIPVELSSRDGLGALPNQNAAATFKLRIALAKLSDIFSSAPATTAPNVRVEVFIECWDQPESQVAGRVNQITPPALNTTQFWSSQVFNVNAGQQTIRLSRVGNYIRNLIMVYRSAAGARTATDFPALTTLYLDTRPLDIFSRDLMNDQMVERTGRFGAAEAVNGIDTGVYLYDFTHEFDGKIGRENRDLWLPTLGSTRLEVQGTFGNAGTLTVLTNDVAVAGEAFL